MKSTKTLFGILTITAALAMQVHAQSGYALFIRPTDTIWINGHTLVTNQITMEAEILISSSLAAPTSSYPRIFEEQLGSTEDKAFWASPSLVGGSTWIGDNQEPQGYGQQLGVTNPVAEDVWHHLAFVHDSNELRVYLDGVEIGILDFAGDPSIANSADGVMSIGAFLYNGGTWLTNSFLGAIQWVRVSSVARYSGTSITPPATVPASDSFTQVLFDFTHVAPGTSIVYDLSPNQFTGTVGVGFSGATAPSFVQTNQSFLTNGLVAYYPFNGNANDASGNGYNGTPTDITYGYDRFGQPSNAAEFDGISSQIPIYGFPNGNFFPVTVSVWVNGTPGEDSDTGVIGNYAISSANGWALFAYGDHVRSWYFGSEGSVYGVSQGLQGLNTLDGNWHQVIVTYDSNGGVIYVDGLPVDSLAWSGSPAASTSTQPVIIGDYTDGIENRPFDGSLDDIRIYNLALSSNEVQELYAYESQPLSIINQPQSAVVNAYDTTLFTVTAFGTLPLSYQWSLNGSNISGATSNSLTISNVVQTNLGTYAVVVTNLFGSVASSNATLSMYPFLATPFGGLDTYWGYTNTLSVEAWGTGPLSYQWFDDGVAIDNATNQTLTFTDIQLTNAGLYSIVVTSPLGSVTNTPEQVVVNPAGVSFGGLYPSVIIQGVVGFNYIIQSTANLSDTNAWVTVTNLVLTQPIQLWVDTNTDASLPANPNRFYRVLPGQ